MQKTHKTLKTAFLSVIILAALIACLFETGVFTTGLWADDKTLEFVWLTIFELFTLAIIPTALYIFKAPTVRNYLTADADLSPRRLLLMGSVRLALLSIPLLANTLLYYMFLNVAFGYLAIILFLSMFFIYPSMGKCLSETTKE